MKQPNMDVTICIQNQSTISSVPEAALLEDWASIPLKQMEHPVEVTLRIVDEDEGRELNMAWRKKDYATNVLSFPIGDTPAGITELLGDIVICAPVVEKEAVEQHKPLAAHWAHLVIHGILHLQGYDHEQQADAEIMENMEITFLEKIGYPNPYETELES